MKADLNLKLMKGLTLDEIPSGTSSAPMVIASLPVLS